MTRLTRARAWAIVDALLERIAALGAGALFAVAGAVLAGMLLQFGGL